MHFNEKLHIKTQTLNAVKESNTLAEVNCHVPTVLFLLSFVKFNRWLI